MYYSQLLEHLGQVAPEEDYEIIGVTRIFDAELNDRSHLCWVADRNIGSLSFDVKRTVISSPVGRGNPYLANASLIVVENPRAAFQKALQLFDRDNCRVSTVADSASVNIKAAFGKNCSIGCNAVIEEGVMIGDNVTIGHNSVILARTQIGDNVTIGNNCTIGGVGFGYEKNDAGKFEVIPHLGNVVIEDDVEIGNNSCIDRAVIGSTILRQNAKIDNLVHISHGCDIGTNSMVIANAMIAGSVVIGKNSWIAPSASVLNQATVGSNVTVGMGAVVLKPVGDGDIVVGNPAKSIKK